MGIVGTKKHGHKCEPNHYGSIHGEADEFGLVEVFRYFPRFNGVNGASCDQNHVVYQTYDKTFPLRFALEYHFVAFSLRRVSSRSRWLEDEPNNR